MEVKLSDRRHNPSLALPKLQFLNPRTTLPSQSCNLKWWVDGKKHLLLLAERWKIQIQEITKGRRSSNPYLVHVVKEGETLTSIARQYGVTIYSIAAANSNIVDIDLVFKGKLLNIPASASADTQMILVGDGQLLWPQVAKPLQCQIKKCGLPCLDQRERLKESMKVVDGVLNQKLFIMQTIHSFPHDKSTGYFLVLVPIIAFCIRCIIGAFHTRIHRDLRSQASNQSRRHHDGSKGPRWKYALSDSRESDNSHSESTPNSCGNFADYDHSSFEETHVCNKLEDEYRKFLSECGISKSGYWRGGSVD